MKGISQIIVAVKQRYLVKADAGYISVSAAKAAFEWCRQRFFELWEYRTIELCTRYIGGIFEMNLCFAKTCVMSFSVSNISFLERKCGDGFP